MKRVKQEDRSCSQCCVVMHEQPSNSGQLVMFATLKVGYRDKHPRKQLSNTAREKGAAERVISQAERIKGDQETIS